MSSDTGYNQTANEQSVTNFLSGGVDLRLMTTALSYDDTATELDSKEVSATSYALQSLADTEFTITHDAANGVMTVKNSVELDFGNAGQDWGTVVDAALHKPGTDQFIRADEVNDPQITEGEDIVLPVGAFEATFGATPP